MSTTQSKLGQWHGGSDHATSPQCVFYTRESASADIHPVQFEAVCARIYELALKRDANGSRLVQLIYTRQDHTSPVVAFRFTSDFAYHQHHGELIALGGSLGRGVFDSNSESTFRRFLSGGEG